MNCIVNTTKLVQSYTLAPIYLPLYFANPLNAFWNAAVESYRPFLIFFHYLYFPTTCTVTILTLTVWTYCPADIKGQSPVITITYLHLTKSCQKNQQICTYTKGKWQNQIKYSLNAILFSTQLRQMFPGWQLWLEWGDLHLQLCSHTQTHSAFNYMAVGLKPGNKQVIYSLIS